MEHLTDSKLTLVDPSIPAASGGNTDIDDVKKTTLRLLGDARPRRISASRHH
ncbi:hypothetical protein J3R82DRAFT_4940 [Butyriboletus roseoflavus]|nr:hypothetical protein J3R82DRAFT_4940 [Butyriboletus roseoflavus]